MILLITHHAQCSVPLAHLQSFHQPFPSSLMTAAVMTSPRPLQRIRTKMMSLKGKDHTAIIADQGVLNTQHSTSKHSTNTITLTKLTVCMFVFLRGSQRKSSALSALFSERWPATPPQCGAIAPPTERNIDFELDVRVEIESGKCMLHPSTQPPEHEDLAVRRWRYTTKWTHYLKLSLMNPALHWWHTYLLADLEVRITLVPSTKTQ